MKSRYQQYLRDRYRLMTYSTGAILIIVAVTMLAPLVVIPFYPEEIGDAWVYLVLGLSLGLIGVLCVRRIRKMDVPGLNLQEGMVVIVMSWIIAFFIGAIPLMIIGELNFVQALFESTSGWTGAGLSVVNVEEAPRNLLMLRSLLQLIGGAGFVIIVLSAITGPAGAGLSAAEGRDEQVAPHLRQSAEIVVNIYLGFIVFGTLALLLAGMSLFDAVNHAFTAIATGGFSTRTESIAYWDSPAIEAVIIVLMILGSINYLTIYVFLQGKVRTALRNGELHLMLIILFGSFTVIFLGVTSSVYPALDEQIRGAIFEVASTMTTTGFSIVAYREWNDLGFLFLIMLMLIGGGSGSTAGGIKQFRIYILLKAVIWEIQRAFMPEHAVNQATIWRGENRAFLNDKQIRKSALYVFVYMGMFFTGTAIFLAHGYPLRESLFEFASTLGTVGVSVGITTADAPTSLLLTQILGMLLGRLEFFAVIIGMTKLIGDTVKMASRDKASSPA